MTTPRPVVEAENRLAVFNANRDRILATINERIIEQYLAAAARAGDSSLEYVLNDIAFSEMRRLEKSSGKRSQRQLQRWRELANQLLRMSQSDKRAELERLVQYYCQDVVGNFNPRVFRFAKGVLTPAVSFLLSPVHGLREGVAALSGVSKRVLVEGELGRIRAACERGTLVFAPTHSSNLDSIVVGLGLVLSQLPPVTYGAGKNLFTNPFISYFMHNLGAYRVDRRLGFGLYKDILKEYSTVLLEHGFHSLFFPGGTRCRSNMIEQHLKLGLLGTAVAAYQNNLRARKARDRIYIVPVTLNYRLVLEAETLIDDYLAETGKSRYIIQDDEFSQLGRILEFARKIMVHESAIIMRFGAPLDPMGHEVDEDGESLDRRGKRVDPASYVRGADGEVVADPQRDAEYTRILGRSLADGYRRETVFLSTHLVARVLMDEVVRKAGTTDIYRLLRLLRAAPAACRVPMERLLAGVDRLRARIDAEPTVGRVLRRIQREPAQAVVDDAMRGLGTYHTRPVALRQGDEAVVNDLKLLFYYQNRLSHIPVEAGEVGEARA